MTEFGTSSRDLYLGLATHTFPQRIVFTIFFVVVLLLFFSFIALPLTELFFHGFLHARVYKNGESFLIDGIITFTHPFFLWIVDVTPINNSDQVLYSLNPILMSLPIGLLFSMAIALFATTALSMKYGLMHQKIQREIVNTIDTVARIVYSSDAGNDHSEIEKTLMEMDSRKLHELAATYHISFDELDTLQKALIWRRTSGIQRIMRISHGMTLYMRMYFTVEYGNRMLGIVYMGAAILIAVIGLRGLKFIPANSPSIIIFALVLEFVLLISYAVTVIYTRDDDTAGIRSRDVGVKPLQTEGQGSMNRQSSQSLSPLQHEAEELLRLFITQPIKKNDDKDSQHS